MDSKNIHSKSIKFLNDLIMVRDFFDNFYKEIEYLEDELKKKGNETQDLLHYMELKKFSASEGYVIARDMQRVRQERREIKDLLKVMTVTHAKIHVNFNKINLLNDAIGEVRKIHKQNNNRQYQPRVRVDLKELINNESNKKESVNEQQT